MKVTTIGLDIAKEVFQVHGVDKKGKVVLRKQLKRGNVASFFATLSPCLVGIEACGGSHYWARLFRSYGHEVKLMAPQYVKPYVKTNKNDRRDAEAICEAVTRPTMRFVPVKTEDQQSVLSLHRGRDGLKKMRTSQANQIRGLLHEFGVVIPQGIANFSKRIPVILDEPSQQLPPVFLELLQRLFTIFQELDLQVKELEKEIVRQSRNNEACKKLEQIPGIGPLTASAFVATLGSAHGYKNGRQVSAWLGLVPRQYSTGGKTVLGRISKRGDCYLRTLLIHGARSVIRHIENNSSPRANRFKELMKRSNKNVTTVALANKNVRTAWALLAHDREYRNDYEEIMEYAKA